MDPHCVQQRVCMWLAFHGTVYSSVQGLLLLHIVDCLLEIPTALMKRNQQTMSQSGSVDRGWCRGTVPTSEHEIVLPALQHMHLHVPLHAIAVSNHSVVAKPP